MHSATSCHNSLDYGATATTTPSPAALCEACNNNACSYIQVIDWCSYQ